jgi:hypothetical protein
MMEAHGGGAALFLAAGKSERERRKDKGPNIFFKGMPPVTSSLSPRHHLLNVASATFLPTAPQAGNQAFDRWAFGKHFRPKL